MNIFKFFKRKKDRDSEIELLCKHKSAPLDVFPPKSGKRHGIVPPSPEPSKAKTEIPEGTKRVHNLIILDESGSMQAIYDAALTGVNETLQTIREAGKEYMEQEHFVTLVTFASMRYNQIYSNTEAEKAADVAREQYRPGGGTPLFDAMGRAITELRSRVEKDDVVLVTVITDGYENASLEYSGKAIKSLIDEMKNEGWVFTYIGANQDVEAVASSMSIDNFIEFEADMASTQAMFQRENRARKNFFKRVSYNMSKSELKSGYFDDL